jgi:hypothetical protein
MLLRSGGDLDGAYRGEVHFSPPLTARLSASALNGAATVATALGRRLGSLTETGMLPRTPLDTTSWASYIGSVADAVDDARSRRVRVVVVTQPYVSDAHVAQQRALSVALQNRFGGDPGVRYVNLGNAVDLHDPTVSYDGLHLLARANHTIAERLLDPVRDISSAVNQP